MNVLPNKSHTPAPKVHRVMSTFFFVSHNRISAEAISIVALRNGLRVRGFSDNPRDALRSLLELRELRDCTIDSTVVIDESCCDENLIHQFRLHQIRIITITSTKESIWPGLGVEQTFDNRDPLSLLIQNLTTISNGSPTLENEVGNGSPLTKRQVEIVQLIGNGLTSKEIASRLGLSKNTVDNHRARAMERLGTNSAIEMVSKAKLAGLIK